jgi:hypothetical protein
MFDGSSATIKYVKPVVDLPVFEVRHSLPDLSKDVTN